MLVGDCGTVRSVGAMAVEQVGNPAVGTVLAFDFGTKRIGVAVGEAELHIAHPLAAIESERKDARFAAVKALIDEWRPSLLIVGLPLAVDGSEHEMTARCRRFANQLAARYALPVRLVDERYSSATAEALLCGAAGGSRADRGGKGRIDAASAQVILQAYFDAADSGAPDV
jgi:putative Holliday junction resolvase